MSVHTAHSSNLSQSMSFLPSRLAMMMKVEASTDTSQTKLVGVAIVQFSLIPRSRQRSPLALTMPPRASNPRPTYMYILCSFEVMLSLILTVCDHISIVSVQTPHVELNFGLKMGTNPSTVIEHLYHVYSDRTQDNYNFNFHVIFW